MNREASLARADVDLRRVATESGECIECRIVVHDAELIGRKAHLVLEQRARVKDSRPIHGRRELARRSLVLSSRETTLRLDPSSFQAYSHRGVMIDLELVTVLTLDDGIIFDTKLSERHELALGWKPRDPGGAESVVEPKDLFEFRANLEAIPLWNRIVTLGLALAGTVVILANTTVGAHDQLVPEGATYFYSHYDSDGDSQSPFFSSLVGSGLIGAGIWALMRRQLRKYMRFELGRLPPAIRLGTSLPVGTIVTGRSRVSLENATLRIVACNLEMGQYQRGSGSKKRTVSFREPTRAVVLFEKTVPRIPAHQPISRFFPDEFSFDPMFEILLPPQQVSAHHGIAIHWEVQLLQDRFVDQELVGPTEGFHLQDFFFG